MKKTIRLLTCILGSAMAARGALMFDFGSAGTGSLVGPGHVGETTDALIPSGETTWNNIAASDGSTVADVGSGIVDSQGNTLTGVSLDLGVGSASLVDWSSQPIARTGVSNDRSGTGVFNNTTFRDFIGATNNNSSPTTVGMRVSGLSAGTYRVWAISRHTYINNDSVASDDYDIWAGAGDASTAPNSLSTASILQYSRANAQANTGSWSVGEGFTWVSFDVTLSGSDDLLVFSESAYDNQNGILNNVQIEVIPEPGTLALFGLAGIAALAAVRRRR